MITLYLDVDGVLANFDKSYKEMWSEFTYDRKRFRSAVLEKHIFLGLERMQGSDTILEMAQDVYNSGVNVEILTSTGSSDLEMIEEGIRQKNIWLREQGIHYKANFVQNKQQKSRFAHNKSILIDDSIGCINPFVEAGGHGILHHHETVDKTKEQLYNIYDRLQNN